MKILIQVKFKYCYIVIQILKIYIEIIQYTQNNKI